MKPVFLFIAALLPSLLWAQGIHNAANKQVKKIVAAVKENFSAMNPCDTLMDVNGDGYKDIVVEFYGSSGTGEKNRTILVMYDKVNKRFDTRHQIDLSNVHFDFKKRTVSSYYVAYGGGGASLSKWRGIRLVTLEEVEVDVEPEPVLKFKMTKKNHITGKTTHWVSDEVDLPAVYHYYKYKHVIRRCSESDD